MTLTILATTILFLVGQQKGIAAEQPQPTPTDQPLTAVATVPAPIKDVWKAYTTTDGIIAWMVPKGTVDFRIGGKYVTSYDPKSDLKGSDTIENTILCFDPERMVTIRCTKTPENFPFKRAMSEVWTTVYFRSISESKTEVTCRMIGFDGSDESNRLRDFFRLPTSSYLMKWSSTLSQSSQSKTNVVVIGARAYHHPGGKLCSG